MTMRIYPDEALIHPSVSEAGEGLTVNYCQCCLKIQPNGTLYLCGFRAYCSECLLHYKSCSSAAKL